MKAQISTIEMIIAVIILFIAFNIFFPGFSFKSEWEDASLLLKGRDILLAMDRTNNLVEYSFNNNALDDFVNQLFPTDDTMIWTSVDDALKSKLVIACNCTNETRSNLDYWLKDLKLNNRSIDALIYYTNLESINTYNGKYPDVLIIWGYKDLSEDKYRKVMRKFLDDGNGIVEICDLTTTDDTQREIFGITDCADITSSCGWGPERNDGFNEPSSINISTYQPYKYFYHVPFPAKAPEIVGAVPVEGVPACSATETKKGNFIFRENTMDFWICDYNTVYFDTDANGNADFIVNNRGSFNLTDYNFYLNYIEDSSILISFREIYNFTDFLMDGSTTVYPVDQDVNRIFLSKGEYPGTDYPIPVVIVNESIGKTAWVANFSRSGLENVGDDHKQLLNSLILFVSNKEAKELTYGTVEFGRTTSYLDVMNYDMFEIYKLNLGVGHPF